LEQRVKAMDGHYAHIRLTPPTEGAAAPLSWWLSRAAQTELDRQMCSDVNVVEFRRLAEFLKSVHPGKESAAEKLLAACSTVNR
jgi:hypothetical protein